MRHLLQILVPQLPTQDDLWSTAVLKGFFVPFQLAINFILCCFLACLGQLAWRAIR
jgi:hypothetical protein